MTRARDVANIDGVLTTTGDTFYASAAATPARLGIGSTGQILTVASGVPSWATPAGGGGMTLLSTTTLSGATTTISSISQDYVNLFVMCSGAVFNGAGPMYLEPNAVTDNADWVGVKYVQGSAPTATGSNATAIALSGGNNIKSSQSGNTWAIVIPAYTTSDVKKLFQWSGNFVQDSPEGPGRIQASGNSLTNDAITSLRFKNPGGSFTGGTVKIYGVK